MFCFQKVFCATELSIFFKIEFDDLVQPLFAAIAVIILLAVVVSIGENKLFAIGVAF